MKKLLLIVTAEVLFLEGRHEATPATSRYNPLLYCPTFRQRYFASTRPVHLVSGIFCYNLHFNCKKMWDYENNINKVFNVDNEAKIK